MITIYSFLMGIVVGGLISFFIWALSITKYLNTKSKMKIDKITHRGFVEFLKAKASGNEITQIFGEFQYIFETRKGRISLVELKDGLMDDSWYWEIMELSKKNLFEDVEKFQSKELAEIRIKELLE